MPKEIMEAPHTFCRKDRATGLVHVIDMNTGLTVAVQKSMEVNLYHFPDIRQHRMEYQNFEGRQVWVERGLDIELCLNHNFKYSELKACLFCERVANGDLITDICDDPEMPDYSVICYWRAHNPSFNKMLVSAKVDSADKHFDEVVKTADASNSKDSDKLKIDAHKWAAEVRSPDEYGKKTKLSGDANAPIQFIIDTGIRVAGDEGYNVDETLKSRDVTDSGELDGETDAEISDAGATADVSDSGDSSEAVDVDGDSPGSDD